VRAVEGLDAARLRRSCCVTARPPRPGQASLPFPCLSEDRRCRLPVGCTNSVARSNGPICSWIVFVHPTRFGDEPRLILDQPHPGRFGVSRPHRSTGSFPDVWGVNGHGVSAPDNGRRRPSEGAPPASDCETVAVLDLAGIVDRKIREALAQVNGRLELLWFRLLRRLEFEADELFPDEHFEPARLVGDRRRVERDTAAGPYGNRPAEHPCVVVAGSDVVANR
jgi:hypothetical protein